MNVLIVEDSLPMRRMIRSLIVPLTEKIFEGGGGGEALRIYRRHKPDWVLMDIRLKESDGIAATGQIRLCDPQAKILIVTGYDDKNLQTAAGRAGAIDYLVKDELHRLPAVLIGAAFNFGSSR